MNVVRRRVRVRGRVQGVWFRGTAEREAVGRGVAGFARNERDGSVLLELEGPVDAVDEVVAWCRLGPSRAEVTAVDIEDVPVLGTTGFRTD